MSSTPPKRWSKDTLLAMLFFAAVFLFLLRPVGAEQDFWWHLATGRWIWEHKALPSADPFALFPVHLPDSHDLLILRGYWLSQSLYYLLYLAGGLLAICTLGSLTMTATCLLVWTTLRQHLPGSQSLQATTPLVIACSFFSEHRPQLYSFLLPAHLPAGTYRGTIPIIGNCWTVHLANTAGHDALGSATPGLHHRVPALSHLRSRDYR